MRAWMLILVMVMGLSTGVQAGADTADRVIHGLLRLGQGALENELERREAESVAKAEAAARATEPKKRTWGDRGADMVGTFLGTAADELGKRSSSEVLAFSLKDSMDVLIDEYKEQYKKEGRAYAKELGDRMVERVKEDPKISSALTAIQVLCWSIIVYLSLVTVFVFCSFVSLRRGNKSLRRSFEALKKKFDELQREKTAARADENEEA